MLPAAALILLLTTRWVNRAVVVHRIEQQQESDRMRLAQVVSSIRHDAGEAERAVVEHHGDSVVLRLEREGRSVEYKVTAPQITRIEHAGESRLSERRWAFKSVEADWFLETVRGEDRIVWARFVVHIPIQVGEQVHRAGRNASLRPTTLSAAFAVGRGGVR
jgi:hypothetical protein